MNIDLEKNMTQAQRDFFELLERAGKIAEENGMTEEILNEILKEEDALRLKPLNSKR